MTVREMHTPAVRHGDLRPGDRITWDDVDYTVTGPSRSLARNESDPSHKYGSIAIPTTTGELLVPVGYLLHPVNLRRTDELVTRTLEISDLEWEILSNPERCECGHLVALHHFDDYRTVCPIPACYCPLDTEDED